MPRKTTKVPTKEERVERLQRILEGMHEEWERLDRPMTTPGSLGSLVEHPLLAMIRSYERLIHDLTKQPGRAGRPQGSHSAPDRLDVPPKREQLSAVTS
jgi:hypothetical protein